MAPSEPTFLKPGVHVILRATEDSGPDVGKTVCVGIPEHVAQFVLHTGRGFELQRWDQLLGRWRRLEGGEWTKYWNTLDGVRERDGVRAERVTG